MAAQRLLGEAPRLRARCGWRGAGGRLCSAGGSFLQELFPYPFDGFAGAPRKLGLRRSINHPRISRQFLSLVNEPKETSHMYWKMSALATCVFRILKTPLAQRTQRTALPPFRFRGKQQ